MLNELLTRVEDLEKLVGDLTAQLEEQRILNKLSPLTTSEELDTMPPLAREIAKDMKFYRALGFLTPTDSGKYLGMTRTYVIDRLLQEGYIAEDRTPLKHPELMMHVPVYDSEGILWHAYHPELLDMISSKETTGEWDL